MDYKPYKTYAINQPFTAKEVNIKFIIEIDGDQIYIDQEIMAILANNEDGSLNHFIAGYLHEYPQR